jgi:hypothetical protein
MKKNLCGKVSYFESTHIVYPYIINCLQSKLKAYNDACNDSDGNACEIAVRQLCDVIKFYNMFDVNKEIDEILMKFKDDEYDYSLLLSVLNCEKLWPDVKINFTDAIDHLKNIELKQTLINAHDPDPEYPDTNIVSVLGQYRDFKPGKLYGENDIDAGNLYKKLLATVTFMLHINDVKKTLIGRDVDTDSENDHTDSENSRPSTPGSDSDSNLSSIDSNSSTPRSNSPSPPPENLPSTPRANSPLFSSSSVVIPIVTSPSVVPTVDLNEENINAIYKQKSKPTKDAFKPIVPFFTGKNKKTGINGGKKSRRKPKKKKRTIRRRIRQ